ncbi:MAG: hypothetical protein PHV06_08230, partial [bacterium]|nr:hypothetical protein [bacterium]
STPDNCIDFGLFNDFIILLKKGSIEYLKKDSSTPVKLKDIQTVFPITRGFSYGNDFVFKLNQEEYCVAVPSDSGYVLYFGKQDKILNENGIYLSGGVTTSYSINYDSIPPSEKLSYEFGYLHIFVRDTNRYITVFQGNKILMYKIINNDFAEVVFEKNLGLYKDFRYAFRDVDLNGQNDLVIFSDMYTSSRMEVYWDGDISSKPFEDRVIENAVDIHGGNLNEDNLSDFLILYFIHPISLKQYVTSNKLLNIYYIPRIQWEKGRYKRVGTKANNFIKTGNEYELFFTLNNFILSDLTGDNLDDIIYYFNKKIYIQINDSNLNITGDPSFVLDVSTVDKIATIYYGERNRNLVLVFRDRVLNIFTFS